MWYKYGFTALLYAAQNGADEIVELLIKSKKCNLEFSDENGCTSLHKAAMFGHTSVVKHLLKAGCDKNKKDKRELTPCDLATEWNETQIAELLKRENNNYPT